MLRARVSAAPAAALSVHSRAYLAEAADADKIRCHAFTTARSRRRGIRATTRAASVYIDDDFFRRQILPRRAAVYIAEIASPGR